MTSHRAAIYCRISQDREGAGLGVERQRTDCDKLARKLGWKIVTTYTDNDLSAYSGKPRPGYRALLSDIEAGRVDAVLIWHTDRLHRSPRELEEYVDLCERKKIITQTVKAGELDLGTPSGRAVARTLGAWARFEVEHKSERAKRAQEQAARDGRWHGGAIPLGWNVRSDGTATLDRRAASRIRRATHDVLAGASLGSIVRAWNDEPFPTGTYWHGCPSKPDCPGRRGRDCPERITKPWNYSTLRQVLTRARNAGLIEHNGEIVAQSPWPAIVTEDVWRALCALLNDPTRRRSTSNRARWLLAGIAVCGADGCALGVKSATVGSAGPGGNRTVYRCTAAGTGHVARAARPVDELVSMIVAERLRQPDVSNLLVTAADPVNTDALRTEAMALRVRLDEAAESFAEGLITKSQLATITARVQTNLDDVQAKMISPARDAVVGAILSDADPARAWERAPIDRQRALVRELLTVTILPSGKRGRAFDPELVRIDWQR